MWPGVDSASETEYQVNPGGKGDRCVRLTTYHLHVPMSRNLGALTSWNPVGLIRPVMGQLRIYIYIYIYICIYICIYIYGTILTSTSDRTTALGSNQPLLKMSTRNIPGGKGGRCVRLTSPPSRAECHEIWEPKPPGTPWATPGLLPDCFTFKTLTSSETSLSREICEYLKYRMGQK
jgi:hypothetical protein